MREGAVEEALEDFVFLEVKKEGRRLKMPVRVESCSSTIFGGSAPDVWETGAGEN